MQNLMKSAINNTALVKSGADLNVLESINWDFSHNTLVSAQDVAPFNCRKYHWFPGTFIPQIPFTLIEVLSLPDAMVLDPFLGIGTTFFQALSLKRQPIGVEICIVAATICRCMLRLFDPQIDFGGIKGQIDDEIGSFDANIDYSGKLNGNIQIEQLRPWYERNTFNKLCYLFFIEEKATAHMNAAMTIVISSILKTLSSQDRGWGCIADNMIPKPSQIKERDVFLIFNKSLNILFNDLICHQQKLGWDYQSFYKKVVADQSIFHDDVRKSNFIADDSVDIVITSPPYVNMIDYVTSQRLSYYYFGSSIPEDSEKEIGARNRRKRRDTLNRYINDMQSVNRIVFDKLKVGGYVCYIMPAFNMDNDKNRERKEITDNIMLSMKEMGLIPIYNFNRAVSNKRRDHNSKWTSLEEEKIHIYRKA